MSDHPRNDDQASRAALRWLAARRAVGWRTVYAGLLFAPVVAGLAVAWWQPAEAATATGLADDLWPADRVAWALATAVVLLPFALVAYVVLAEERARSRRVAPIVSEGRRDPARITAIEQRADERGVVRRTTLVVTARLGREGDGDGRRGSFAQLEHRALPTIERGAEAYVWTADGRWVIGAGGLLFESEPEG